MTSGDSASLKLFKIGSIGMEISMLVFSSLALKVIADFMEFTKQSQAAKSTVHSLKIALRRVSASTLSLSFRPYSEN